MFYNSVMGFVTAVHWTEPWIICLGIFHMTLLIAVFATRTNSNLQIGLFGFVLSLVYFAETINGIAVSTMTVSYIFAMGSHVMRLLLCLHITAPSVHDSQW